MPIDISKSTPNVSQASANHVIGIVVSDYNSNITHKLSDAAVETLVNHGIPHNDIWVVHVPGAWELSFATQRLLALKNVCGVIALGAVIKGETSHDQHINRAVSLSLMQLSLDRNKPVAFGLLTVNSLEQAIQRSGGNVGNKGQEAASALLESLTMCKIMDEIEAGGK